MPRFWRHAARTLGYPLVVLLERGSDRTFVWEDTDNVGRPLGSRLSASPN
jgi:hypothetical protein